MRNIPDDIAEVAASICANAGITDIHARKVFAAAILAERQRCARQVYDATFDDDILKIRRMMHDILA